MKEQISQPIISILAEYLPDLETHASINNLFMYADAPGEPPEGSKPIKVQEWLRSINKQSKKPLTVLGKLIEQYMDMDLEEDDPADCYTNSNTERLNLIKKLKEKINKQLSVSNLTYRSGGVVYYGESAPSKQLGEIIHNRDVPAIEEEFHRALKKVFTEPKEAVSAACNILESVFKTYIQDEQLDMPHKQDIRSLWKKVVEQLRFDPKSVADDDLKKVLSGFFSIIDGIGSFRTHTSSAHGSGRKIYRLKPRHARLAVNAAHTLALFVIETWDEKK